jgi:hypothetical protein
MTRLLHAVVCPLERLRVDVAFPRRDWPLHVTLLGNFVWDGTDAELVRRVDGVIGGGEPIDAVVGDDAMFGADRSIPVNLIVPHPEVAALHEALIDERMAFVDPQYLRGGYQPHITHFPSGRRHEGDRVRLEQVVLARMAGDAASIHAVWDWR